MPLKKRIHTIKCWYKDGTLAIVQTQSFIKLALFKGKLKKTDLGQVDKLTIDGKVEIWNE